MLHEIFLARATTLALPGDHSPATHEAIPPQGIYEDGRGMMAIKVKTCLEVLPPQRGILTHQNSDVLLFFLQEVL